MSNEKMGQFISELRKSHQMTQKELAEKLNVSDKAVSKWERGLSYPDISLLSPLSDILGITTTELLNGERAEAVASNVEVSIVNALEYGEKSVKRKIQFTQNIWAAVVTIMLLIAIFVVSIVNVAISGSFTWSLIPISCCIFAWPILFPIIKLGAKGIARSFIAISILTIPFLYVLDYTINRIIDPNQPVFTLGVRIAPPSIVFLWICFLLFKKLTSRKLLAIAFVVFLTAPLSTYINYITSKTVNEPLSDMSVIINAISLIIAAIILFVIELIIHTIRKRKEN